MCAVFGLTIKAPEGLYQFYIADILYIECRGRKKELTTLDNTIYKFFGRIEDIENDLKKHGFIRPHNSYLVNGIHVRKVMKNNLLLTEKYIAIPVSRKKYKQAYDDITVYAKGARL